MDANEFIRHLHREQERARDIEHEKKLAEIRAQSRALVWTGPADELLNAIKKFYEEGWIKADDLADAVQKASIHFVRPDGTRVPLLTTAQEPTEIFSHSPTYQKVTFRGKEYDLTAHRYAPDILKVLHQSLKKGESGLTIKQIRQRASLPQNGSMYDWFRKTGLWKTLVVTSRDLYRLDIAPNNS